MLCFLPVDALDGGNGEGQRLAGAGLGAADHVRAGAQEGNGGGLNVGGLLKAQLVHGPLHLGNQPELGKFQFVHFASAALCGPFRDFTSYPL